MHPKNDASANASTLGSDRGISAGAGIDEGVSGVGCPVNSVIKKILEHLGLWEDSHAPPSRGPPKAKEITFDPSYSQLI